MFGWIDKIKNHDWYKEELERVIEANDDLRAAFLEERDRANLKEEALQETEKRLVDALQNKETRALLEENIKIKLAESATKFCFKYPSVYVERDVSSMSRAVEVHMQTGVAGMVVADETYQQKLDREVSAMIAQSIGDKMRKIIVESVMEKLGRK